MFTSIHSHREEDARAFDERTAAALQTAIAYLSEIVTQERTELIIGRMQALLERNGHPYHLDDCQFMRDCIVNEELDREQQLADAKRKGLL